jgi:DNA-binding response OmpR family regulator
MPASPAVALDLPWSAVPGCETPVAAAIRDAILLVEDDEMVSGLVRHVLERQRWRVLQAGDGASGIRLVAEQAAAIALALVDCSLPDTDGAALCDRVRAALPGLPLLVMSGRDQVQLAQTQARGGPAAFLSKPFLPGEVARQVQALMTRAAWSPPARG